MMQMTIPSERLSDYLLKLIENYLPDGFKLKYSIKPLLDISLQKIEFCFSRINRKYYQENGVILFDHLNGDHFASLLYFLSNTAWREMEDTELPTRLFYLNKIMHGIDLFYSISMPNIFLLIHPLGTVLGKADYNDFLVVYQKVTVGANTNIYPKLGKEVILFSGSSVIGNCQVGDDVIFGANSLVINQNIESHTVVVGQHPNHRLLKNQTPVIQRVFDSKTSK